jgi:hypothetical protein
LKICRITVLLKVLIISVVFADDEFADDNRHDHHDYHDHHDLALKKIILRMIRFRSGIVLDRVSVISKCQFWKVSQNF